MAKNPLDDVIAALRQRGVQGVRRLNDPEAYEEARLVLPTGLPALDDVIGVGGFPSNKLVEIFGPESVGKSTLVKYLSGHFQSLFDRRKEFPSLKLTKQVYVSTHDTEQSGALEYDKTTGVRPEDALASQPTTCEEVLAELSAVGLVMAQKRLPCAMIWDSLAATLMAEELDAEFDELMNQPGAMRARYLSKALPKLVNQVLRQGDLWLIIVNQLRDKYGAKAYEKQTYAPGGRALRHWAHVRLEMSSLGKLIEKGEMVGIKSKITAVKNKLATPYRSCELTIRFKPVFSLSASVPRTPALPAPGGGVVS